MKKAINKPEFEELAKIFAGLLHEVCPEEYDEDTYVLFKDYTFIDISKKPPIIRKKLMSNVKHKLKSSGEKKPTEEELIQSSVQKQHEITWNRALLGNNLASNGPWSRAQLPLLKTKPRTQEFFVRADGFSVVQYYLDEYRNRCATTLFYPSESWIQQYEDRKIKSGNTVYEKLYEQLKENGLGQIYLPATKVIPRKPLKRKESPIKRKKLKTNGTPVAKVQLKPKATKKLRLKRK